MRKTEIAYLGPRGSFASLVAQKKHPSARLHSFPTIPEVAEFVQHKGNRHGIVPIENSSAGIILETIDALIARPSLVIREELGIRVRLAFLGRKNREIKVIYSHFAPLHHCDRWIKKNYPSAEVRRVSSTSEAVRIASREKNAAALATRDAASLYKLDVLEFPVEKEVVNVTNFFELGQNPNPRKNTETSLLVALKNESGSLSNFLIPFGKAKVNLKRIVSRNIIGQPHTYVFFIGVEAAEKDPKVRLALKKAGKHAVEIRILGSYPTQKPYLS